MKVRISHTIIQMHIKSISQMIVCHNVVIFIVSYPFSRILIGKIDPCVLIIDINLNVVVYFYACLVPFTLVVSHLNACTWVPCQSVVKAG